MIPPTERARATLRAVIAFGKERGRWPDLNELHRFQPRLGCRTTLYRALQYLRNLGLIELRGHTQTARWLPTEDGFALLRKPRFVPALELQALHIDAAALLAARLVPIIRSMSVVIPPGATALFAPDLPVFE